MSNSPFPGLAAWQSDLALLALVAGAANPDQTERVLRQAHCLVSACPRQWQGALAGVPAPDRFEALLACGAHDEAALALVDGRAGYMISHPREGGYLATVVFEGLTEERSAVGDKLALAIIGALAKCLAGQGEPALADAQGNDAAPLETD